MNYYQYKLECMSHNMKPKTGEVHNSQSSGFVLSENLYNAIYPFFYILTYNIKKRSGWMITMPNFNVDFVPLLD